MILAGAPSAIASMVPEIGLGYTPGAAITTQHDYALFLKGWFIGPVSVNHDASAGAWVKELNGPGWGWPRRDNTYNLLEVIRIGDGPAWNGWQEEILTEVWNWVNGGIFALASGSSAGASSSPFNGRAWNPFSGLTLLDRGDISSDHDGIRFDFTALGTNTCLLVWKTLEWDGPGRPNGSIQIAERMSTVPLPGAAWMLGAGLVGSVAVRKGR